MVLIEHPTVRSIERIDIPSHRRVRICARLARGSLFMPHIYELISVAPRFFFMLTARISRTLNRRVHDLPQLTPPLS